MMSAQTRCRTFKTCKISFSKTCNNTCILKIAIFNTKCAARPRFFAHKKTTTHNYLILHRRRRKQMLFNLHHSLSRGRRVEIIREAPHLQSNTKIARKLGINNIAWIATTTILRVVVAPEVLQVLWITRWRSSRNIGGSKASWKDTWISPITIQKYE